MMADKQSKAQDLTITITADDKLISLIETNTNKTPHNKSTQNIIKTLTLIAHGTSRKAACDLTGVRLSTVHRWAREAWYREVVETIRDRLDDELDAVLTGVVHKAASAVIDRLDHGDWIINKEGQQERKPVSAKEAMVVAGIAYDKRALKRGKPTHISEQVSTEDRLDTLADRFRKMAIVTEVEEAEFEEVTEDANKE